MAAIKSEAKPSTTIRLLNEVFGGLERCGLRLFQTRPFLEQFRRSAVQILLLLFSLNFSCYFLTYVKSYIANLHQHRTVIWKLRMNLAPHFEQEFRVL